MPRYFGNCKQCGKEMRCSKDFTYARYNFCSLKCKTNYLHKKQDNCCLHK